MISNVAVICLCGELLRLDRIWSYGDMSERGRCVQHRQVESQEKRMGAGKRYGQETAVASTTTALVRCEFPRREYG